MAGQAERSAQALSRQAEICSAALFRDKAGLGSERNDPIFVVGLPRSGSTLIEQILASHSLVDGTVTVNGMELERGDGLAASGEEALRLEANGQGAELLLFDLQ